jgi:leader peptidase (prepilin peptidase)/N-methyltransferase
LIRRITGADAVIGLFGLAAVIASLVLVPSVRGGLGAGLALLMLAIAVIDARHLIIPDRLNAAAFALTLLQAAVSEPQAITEAIAFACLRGAVLALLFLGLRALYARLRAREGLRLGDVKLAGVAGAWLDWLTIPVAIEIAAFTALTAYILRNLARKRPLHAAGLLPFGLFLAPAIWLCWLLQMTLLVPF